MARHHRDCLLCLLRLLPILGPAHRCCYCCQLEAGRQLNGDESPQHAVWFTMTALEEKGRLPVLNGWLHNCKHTTNHGRPLQSPCGNRQVKTMLPHRQFSPTKPQGLQRVILARHWHVRNNKLAGVASSSSSSLSSAAAACCCSTHYGEHGSGGKVNCKENIIVWVMKACPEVKKRGHQPSRAWG